jgi:uncharacterized membrane protein YdjX (TVP38/TMEM64 family)
MKSLKTALVVVFLAAVIYVLKFSPLSYYFFDAAGRGLFIGKFSSYMKAVGVWWAPFVFLGFYAVCVLLFIPASVPTSIGGLVFGQWYGLGLNFAGAMLGGTLSFILAKYLLRDMVSGILKAGHFKKLDESAGEHGFSIIVYMRLLFVPFTYLSFAAGISKIKFSQFFWGTVVGSFPGLLVVTFLVTALKKIFLTYKTPTDLLRFDIIFPITIFILSFFIPPVVRRLRRKFDIVNEPEIKE